MKDLTTWLVICLLAFIATARTTYSLYAQGFDTYYTGTYKQNNPEADREQFTWFVFYLWICNIILGSLIVSLGACIFYLR